MEHNMEQQRTNQLLGEIDVGCPAQEAVTNHLVGAVDVCPLEFGYWRLNTKINSMLSNPVLCDVDIRDLWVIMEELGIQDQWKEMNAKIRAELEGITKHVTEATKILDANPPPAPEYKFVTAPAGYVNGWSNYGHGQMFRMTDRQMFVAEPAAAAAVAAETVVVQEAAPVVQEAAAVAETVVVEQTVAAETEVAAAASTSAETKVEYMMPNMMPLGFNPGFNLGLAVPTFRYEYEPVHHKEVRFAMEKPELVSMPYTEWTCQTNKKVANANVSEIIPAAKQVITRRLFGEWDALMEDVVEWHKRGLNRFTVRMCMPEMCRYRIVRSTNEHECQKQ